MITGESFQNVRELKRILVTDRRMDYYRTVTEKMMMYAVGRELKSFDMPQVRAVVRRAAAQNYRLSAIVSGIVSSDAFRMQAAASAKATVAKKD